jgi:hypothetical protein
MDLHVLFHLDSRGHFQVPSNNRGQFGSVSPGKFRHLSSGKAARTPRPPSKAGILSVLGMFPS